MLLCFLFLSFLQFCFTAAAPFAAPPVRVVESGDVSPASDLLRRGSEPSPAQQTRTHLFTPRFAVPLPLVPNRGTIDSSKYPCFCWVFGSRRMHCISAAELKLFRDSELHWYSLNYDIGVGRTVCSLLGASTIYWYNCMHGIVD